MRALFPGAAVLGVAVAVIFTADEATVEGIAGTYGLVVYGAGLALAWVFHRSRAFMALGVLGFLDIAVVGRADRLDLLLPLGTVALGVLALVSLLRDRGMLSPVGAAQSLAVASLTALGGFFFADAERVAEVAARPDLAPLWAPVPPGVPAVTAGVAAFALIAAGWGFLRYRGPIEHALAWAILMVLAAMAPVATPAASALLLVGAGLTVAIGVVEASYVMAYRDELTGLPGRRALMQYLDGLNGTYTLAMVDVDHFKQFNDRHGHDVGDQVLKLVASRLAGVSGGGKAYRYGGEEFTILFPGRVKEEARPHLEAIRATIEASKFSVRSWKRPRKKPEGPPKKKKAKKPKKRPRKLSVTVSIGLADTSGKASTTEALFKKADQALYKAKDAGRNQVSG